MNLHPITQVATDLPSSLLAFSMPSGMEWLVVLAIGLATLYKRTTSGVATGLFITYAVIALAFAYFAG